MPEAPKQDIRELEQRILAASRQRILKQLLEDPSRQGIEALRAANRALEEAARSSGGEAAPEAIPNWQAVLDYIAAAGRKVGKSKLYTDIQKGRLRKQPDGTFRPRDVDRYMASLPTAGTPQGEAEKAADRQRRKEEAEIRRSEAAARREELELAVREQKYVRRDQLWLELAARAIALRDALKTAFESRAAQLIAAVDGSADKAPDFLDASAAVIDEALGAYAAPVEIDVSMTIEEEDE